MPAATVLYKAREITEHLIESRFVASVFKVKVVTPLRLADESERFPVVYATDSDEFFGGLSTLAYELQLLAETPRFILVAIGYGDAGSADLLRMRDLFDHASRVHFQPLIEQLAVSPLGSATVDLKAVNETTDATQFLRFITEELMPVIEAGYPVLTECNTYYGYSAGATFGLYALFSHCERFSRYILGSPATSLNGEHFAIAMAKNYAAAVKSADADVFMSVGELEEIQRGLGEFDFVTGYYRLVKHLNEGSLAGIRLVSRIFAGETHATAWTLAFSHGLKLLLGPAKAVPHLSRFDEKR